MPQHKRRELERGESYRLCATDFPWAWFTDLADFEDLHTDKLANKGERLGVPFHGEGYELLKVAVDGPLGDVNLRFSSEQINRDRKAWLANELASDRSVAIPAKVSLEEFIELVEKAGGNVYIPSDRVDSEALRP